MKQAYLYMCVMLCLIGLPLSVVAFEFRFDPDVYIGNDFEHTDQNVYSIGLRTWIDLVHEQDIVSIAREQTIQGTIFGDVLLFGDTATLSGEYFDDVRIVANTVSLNGVTNKDLIIVARNVVLEEGSIINGSTFILANSVFVKGQILGDVQITANNVELSGSIMTPATITAQRFFITNAAHILSEISYFSPQRAQIEEGANIQKQLNFNQIESISQNEVFKRIFFAFVSFWSIIKLIATLFIIFMLTQLFRVFSQRIIDIVHIQKLYAILIGLACAIGVPLLIIVLFGSLVLIPVALILSFVFGIVFIILPAISAIIVASLYQKYIQKVSKINVEFNMSALALIALTLIWFIPVFGTVIKYVLYLVSISAVCTYLYEQVRRKKVM